MKINILCHKKGVDITGGNLYDNHLFQQLEQNKLLEINYVTDEQIRCHNMLLYSWDCLRHKQEISNCDNLIINSCRFSKLLPFIWYFKRNYPKKKIITIHHHFAYRQLNGIKRIIYKLLEINFLRLCDIIITPNPYVRQELQLIHLAEKVSFLELAFSKKSRPRQTTIPGRLLYVGTIEPRKGLEYLIKAMIRLPIEETKNISLHIVGKITEHKYHESLLKLISKYNLQNSVKFCGRISDEELTEEYCNAQCFVFPSLNEGYGMVIIEAMSYGLPVIAFNNTAMPFTIKHGINGLLAKNKNARDLATQIHIALTENALYNKMSIGAKSTFERVRAIQQLDKDIYKFAQLLINTAPNNENDRNKSHCLSQ